MINEKEVMEQIEKMTKRIEDMKKELVQLREENVTQHIKVLTREDIKELFNCERSKMYEIMHSKNRPPVVFIGRDYYSTEKQMKEYFDNIHKKLKRNVSNNCNILYKEELIEMFKMGKNRFKKFTEHNQCPFKNIDTQCYVSEDKLQQWFYDFEGKKIDLY